MTQNDEELINNVSRLRWACRRGMLELDVLLGNFLADAYESLSLEDKRLFVALLNCSDPELFDWLLGQASPKDEGLLRITEMIRHHAKRI
jgi:antitoxin CptB